MSHNKPSEFLSSVLSLIGGVDNPEEFKNSIQRMVKINDIQAHCRTLGADCSTMRCKFILLAAYRDMYFGDIGEYFYASDVSFNKAILLSLSKSESIKWGDITELFSRQELTSLSEYYLTATSLSLGNNGEFRDITNTHLDSKARVSSMPWIFHMMKGSLSPKGEVFEDDEIFNKIMDIYDPSLDTALLLHTNTSAEGYVRLPMSEEIKESVTTCLDTIAAKKSITYDDPEKEHSKNDLQIRLLEDLMTRAYIERSNIAPEDYRYRKKLRQLSSELLGEEIAHEDVVSAICNDEIDGLKSKGASMIRQVVYSIN